MAPFDLLGTLDRRRDLAYEILRIYLGVALFARGVVFIQPDVLGQYITTTGTDWAWPSVFAHAIVMGHLAGGLCLAVGLATRWAAGIQIPVVAAAAFGVHLNEGFMAGGQALELSALVLVMLVAFAIFGGGRLSADYWMTRSYEARLAGAPPPRLRVEPTEALHHHVHALFEDDTEARETLDELVASGLPLTVDIHSGGMWDRELIQAGLAHRGAAFGGPLLTLLATVVGALAGLAMPYPALLGALVGAAAGAFCGTAYGLSLDMWSSDTVSEPELDEVVAGIREGSTMVHVDVIGDEEEVEVEEILHRHHVGVEHHNTH